MILPQRGARADFPIRLRHIGVAVGLFFLSLYPAAALQQRVTLRGTVSDAVTNEPLAAANIRVLFTSRGTISNDHGEYVLTFERGPAVLVFSYLAYQPDTVHLALAADTTLDVRLTPSPIQIPEVVVLAEDPAVEIIRKAIAHKRTWMALLKSYTFDAFTRQVLWRDTAIASITEAYTSGFMKAGDTLREVVRQRRQTQNIPTAENFAAVRRIVNFNEDDVSLFSFRVNGRSSGFTFVGPTAQNALDNYDYKLLSTNSVGGVDVYTIRMTPKSRLKPLFEGTIMIADGTFAVMGVDVKPNETFMIPFVKNIDLRYRQQFALYDSTFWMPTDIRIHGGFNVSIIGITLPRIGIDLTSSIYNYAINAPIPDSVWAKRSVTVDSSAAVYDSTFWKSNQVLPLTTAEQHAYHTLDSTQTLEKQFEPKGPLAALGSDAAGSLFDYLDVRFNRVEGFYFGGKLGLERLLPVLSASGSAGYGFSDDRFKFAARVTIFSSKDRHYGLGAEWYNRLDNVPDEGFYGPEVISLMSLLFKNDYRDYFLANGWRAYLTGAPTRRLAATVSFIAERHYSLDVQSNYSFFSQTDAYRSNPHVAEGAFRSLRLDLRLGPEAEPLDIVSRDAVELSVERSWPGLAGSEFDFTRYHILLTGGIPTFAGDLLFPPTLRVRATGGLGLGALPPQRLFVLDTRSSGYAPFGVLHAADIREFAGDRFVMINIEHNFRTVPFLLLDIPFLYRNGIDLIVHGSFAQTWLHTTPSSGGWYSEAGLGLSRILDIFRGDVTYRFKDPRGFAFSFSIATLF